MKRLTQWLLVAICALSSTANAQPLSRSDVVMLYQTMYVDALTVTPDWTGNVSSCNAGTTSVAYQQAAIDVVNYYRLLAGLPDSVELYTGAEVSQAQEAALIMSANNNLSHAPPSNWACHSTGGANGAARSNLALGAGGIRAVDLYMDDHGAFNAAVGHRRWILFPPQRRMASGTIPAGGQRAANALWVIGGSGTRPATPDGVAWPPAGFVPYTLLPDISRRWSFSYNGADFSGAAVTMFRDGNNIPVVLEVLDNRGFGDRTLVWRADNASYSRPADGDETYDVTVSNVRVGGQPRSFSYQVTVIDPDAVVPEPNPPLFADGFEQ